MELTHFGTALWSLASPAPAASWRGHIYLMPERPLAFLATSHAAPCRGDRTVTTRPAPRENWLGGSSTTTPGCEMFVPTPLLRCSDLGGQLCPLSYVLLKSQ